MELHCAKYKRYFVNFSPSIVNINFTYCSKLVISSILPIFVAKPKYFKYKLIPGSLISIIVIFPKKKRYVALLCSYLHGFHFYSRETTDSFSQKRTDREKTVKVIFSDVSQQTIPMGMLLIVFLYYSNSPPPKKFTFYVSLKTLQNFILYRLHVHNRTTVE